MHFVLCNSGRFQHPIWTIGSSNDSHRSRGSPEHSPSSSLRHSSRPFSNTNGILSGWDAVRDRFRSAKLPSVPPPSSQSRRAVSNSVVGPSRRSGCSCQKRPRCRGKARGSLPRSERVAWGAPGTKSDSFAPHPSRTRVCPKERERRRLERESGRRRRRRERERERGKDPRVLRLVGERLRGLLRTTETRRQRRDADAAGSVCVCVWDGPGREGLLTGIDLRVRSRLRHYGTFSASDIWERWRVPDVDSSTRRRVGHPQDTRAVAHSRATYTSLHPLSKHQKNPQSIPAS